MKCIESKPFPKEQSTRLLFAAGFDFFILRRFLSAATEAATDPHSATSLMAGFKTHITTSTVLGVAYGTAGYLLIDPGESSIMLSTSMLAGGLCSVSGMLPDLDSDSGVPVRETTAFAAAVVPMLMMDRFRHFGWSQEMMVFVGGLIYVVIRFGVAEVFKRYTVHRGMWHSIPAAGIVGLLAFLVCSTENMIVRGFLTGAVVLGFLSHLVLDEIWSFEVRQGKLRIKKSFGTALKLWSKSGWGNFSVYAKLAALIFLAVGDPMLMEKYDTYPANLWRLATSQDGVEETLPAPAGLFESLLPKQPAEADSAQQDESADGDREQPANQLVPSPVWIRR